MRDFSNIEENFTITTTNGTMTKEQYEDFLKRKPQQNTFEESLPLCPMRGAKCRKDCALYDGACLMRSRSAKRDTAGMNCPITGSNCDSSCGFYNKGCTIGGTKK